MEYTIPIRKLMEQYDLEAEDVMYCHMTAAGWGKFEAIFHAYHLSYFDMAKINMFIRERLKSRPGIITMQKDMSEQERAAKKELTTLKDKLKQLQGKKKTSVQTSSEGEEAPMTKEELDSMYISIMRDPNADAKTKMDAGKGWASNHPEVKMEQKEEDQRLNFFLPANCHYCDRCKNCELKGELEKRGCKIHAKRTSPYLWEIVDTSEEDNVIKD